MKKGICSKSFLGSLLLILMIFGMAMTFFAIDLNAQDTRDMCAYMCDDDEECGVQHKCHTNPCDGIFCLFIEDQDCRYCVIICI